MLPKAAGQTRLTFFAQRKNTASLSRAAPLTSTLSSVSGPKPLPSLVPKTAPLVTATTPSAIASGSGTLTGIFGSSYVDPLKNSTLDRFRSFKDVH